MPPAGPLRCTVGGMWYQIHTQIDADFQIFLTFFFFLSKLFVASDLISGFHSGWVWGRGRGSYIILYASPSVWKPTESVKHQVKSM